MNAFPIGPLFGTTSVTDLVTGAASFFSAHSFTPVAFVCWVRSYADLESGRTYKNALPSPEPGDKLQMGCKSSMRTDLSVGVGRYMSFYFI